MNFRFVSSFLLIALSSGALRAADDAALAALKSADDARCAATLSADQAKLSTILSDELRYAHSSGTVDTKASYIESLTSGRLKYVQYDYKERNFSFVSPGVAVMTGQVNVKSVNATGPAEMLLSFLAVWREEGGHWRFFAWQSCKLTPAQAPKK